MSAPTTPKIPTLSFLSLAMNRDYKKMFDAHLVSGKSLAQTNLTRTKAIDSFIAAINLLPEIKSKYGEILCTQCNAAIMEEMLPLIKSLDQDQQKLTLQEAEQKTITNFFSNNPQASSVLNSIIPPVETKKEHSDTFQQADLDRMITEANLAVISNPTHAIATYANILEIAKNQPNKKLKLDQDILENIKITIASFDKYFNNNILTLSENKLASLKNRISSLQNFFSNSDIVKTYFREDNNLVVMIQLYLSKSEKNLENYIDVSRHTI
jgi:hypothetical protein